MRKIILFGSFLMFASNSSFAQGNCDQSKSGKSTIIEQTKIATCTRPNGTKIEVYAIVTGTVVIPWKFVISKGDKKAYATIVFTEHGGKMFPGTAGGDAAIFGGQFDEKKEFRFLGDDELSGDLDFSANALKDNVFEGFHITKSSNQEYTLLLDGYVPSVTRQQVYFKNCAISENVKSLFTNKDFLASEWKQ